MDSFASLALAIEPPTPELLERPPYSRDKYIFSRKMVKNCLSMAIYMIFIIYSVVFAGEYFFPEPDPDFRFGWSDRFVFPGRIKNWDGTPLWSAFEKDYGASRHMTNFFNIFTIMQIFNLVNARKINDEPNVFEGIFNNWMFFGVWVGIAGAQAVIIHVGSFAFKVSRYGIAGEHWAIAIGCGFSTWIVGYLLKFIPDTWCP